MLLINFFGCCITLILFIEVFTRIFANNSRFLREVHFLSKSANKVSKKKMENNVTSEAALGALKSACVKKKYMSFKELLLGEHVVKKFSIVETTHGKRVRVETAHYYLYLPERFATVLTDPVIEELNKSPKIMVYGGKDETDRDRLILDFRDYSNLSEAFEDLLNEFNA